MQLDLQKRRLMQFNSPENLRCQSHLELEGILQKARNEFRRLLMIVAQAGGSDRSISKEKLILVSQLLAASPIEMV